MMGDQGMSFIPLSPLFAAITHPFLHPSSASFSPLCADSFSHRVTAGRDLPGLLSFRLGTDSMDGLVFLIYLLIYLLFKVLYCGTLFFSIDLFIYFQFQSSATDCYSIIACQLHFHKGRKKNNALNTLVGLEIEEHLSRVCLFFINVLACILKMQSRKALAHYSIFMLSLHPLRHHVLACSSSWKLPSLLPASSPVPLMHGARSNVNLSYPLNLT